MTEYTDFDSSKIRDNIPSGSKCGEGEDKDTGFRISLTEAQKPMAKHIKEAFEHNSKVFEKIKLLQDEEAAAKQSIRKKTEQEEGEGPESKIEEIREQISELYLNLYSYIMLDQTTSTGKTFLISHAHHPDCLGLDKKIKVIVLESKKDQRDRIFDEAAKDPENEEPFILKSRVDQEAEFCRQYEADKEEVRWKIFRILTDERCKEQDQENKKDQDDRSTGVSSPRYYFYRRSRRIENKQDAREFLHSHLEKIVRESHLNEEAMKRQELSVNDERTETSSRSFTELYSWLYRAKENGVDISCIVSLFPEFTALDHNLIICTFTKAYVSSLLSFTRVNIWNQEPGILRQILGNYLLFVDESEDFIRTLDDSLGKEAPVVSTQEMAANLISLIEPSSNYVNDATQYFFHDVSSEKEEDVKVRNSFKEKEENFRTAVKDLNDLAGSFVNSHYKFEGYGTERSESGLPIYLKASDKQECIAGQKTGFLYVLKRTEDGTYIETMEKDAYKMYVEECQKEDNSAEGEKTEREIISVHDFIKLTNKAVTEAVRMLFAAAKHASDTWDSDTSFMQEAESAVRRFHVGENNPQVFRYYMNRLTRPYTKIDAENVSDMYVNGLSVYMFNAEYDGDRPYHFAISTVHIPYEANAVLGAMVERAGLTVLGSATGRLPAIQSVSGPFIKRFSGREEYHIPDKDLDTIHQATLDRKRKIYGNYKINAGLITSTLKEKDEPGHRANQEDYLTQAIRETVLKIVEKKEKDKVAEGTLSLIYTSKKISLKNLRQNNVFKDMEDKGTVFLQYDRRGMQKLTASGESEKTVEECRTDGDKIVVHLERNKCYFVFCTYRSGERGINIVGEVEEGDRNILCAVSNLVLFQMTNIVPRRLEEDMGKNEEASFYIRTVLNGALQERHYIEYSSDGDKGSVFNLFDYRNNRHEKSRWDVGYWAKRITYNVIGRDPYSIPSDRYGDKEYSPARATATAAYVQAIGRVRTSGSITVRGDIGIYLDARIFKKNEMPFAVLHDLRPSFEISGMLDQYDKLQKEYQLATEQNDPGCLTSRKDKKRNEEICDFVGNGQASFTKIKRTAYLNKLTACQLGSPEFIQYAAKFVWEMNRFERMKANALNFECQRGIDSDGKEQMYITRNVTPFLWDAKLMPGYESDGIRYHRPSSPNPDDRAIPQLMEAAYNLNPVLYDELFHATPIHTVRKMRSTGRYPYIPYGPTVDIATGETGEKMFEAMFRYGAEAVNSRVEIIKSSEWEKYDVPVLYEDADYFALADEKIIGYIDVKNREGDLDPSRGQEEAKSAADKVRRFHYWNPEADRLKILYVRTRPVEKLMETGSTSWNTEETAGLASESKCIDAVSSDAVMDTEQGNARIAELSVRLVRAAERYFLEG